MPTTTTAAQNTEFTSCLCLFNFCCVVGELGSLYNAHNLPLWVHKQLPEEIRRVFSMTVTERAHMEVTCFSSEGMDAIRAALLAGKRANIDQGVVLNVRYLAAPLYVMEGTAIWPGVAHQAMDNAMERIRDSIAKWGIFYSTKCYYMPTCY